LIVKGFGALFEDDVKNETMKFRSVYKDVEEYILNSGAFGNSYILLEDFFFVYSRYFLYYFDKEGDMNDQGVEGNSLRGTFITEKVENLSKVYWTYFTTFLS